MLNIQHMTDPAAIAERLKAQGVQRLVSDSRQVRAGDAFLAWPGHGQDGRQFVQQAVASGAAALVIEAGLSQDWQGPSDLPVIGVQGLKECVGHIADHFHDQPSQALSLLAVTGTNGKTSTSWWTAQALSLLGCPAGIIGTLGTGLPVAADGVAALISTGLTTPEALTLQSTLAGMRAQGLQACVMEASSIGLEEGRMVGARVKVAMFTNFTQDHLDYHGSMEAYWAAKTRLFDMAGLEAAVINLDDAHGESLAKHWTRPSVLWTYGTHPAAKLRATDVSYRDGGLSFQVHEGQDTAQIQTKLIGDFNVANVLAVLGALRALGHALPDAAAACARLTPVPGRMQRIFGGARDPEVVVDYAHTPDAIDKALKALTPLVTARGGRLICVFGCGGNRDSAKRPIMGGLAEQGAHEVWVTSDNPRNESPQAIIKDILAGMKQPQKARPQADRRTAILGAITGAGPRDVVLVAGKGHETEQETAGVRVHFSDVEEARSALLARQQSPGQAS